MRTVYEGCIEDLAVLVAMRHWAGQCPGDAGWHISALTGREALSAAHEMTLTLTLTLTYTRHATLKSMRLSLEDYEIYAPG